MHTDVNTAQFWARCAPSLDALHSCVHCHMWLKSRLCVFISIHGHRHTHLFLSVLLFLVSLYFFLNSFFHLFLDPAMVPDENSMEDPLCNSSFGSMVSLDYVTPDTLSKCCLYIHGTVETDEEKLSINCSRNMRTKGRDWDANTQNDQKCA